MSAFSLLHISDWHQKGADFDRDVVLDALLDDIKDRKQIDPRLEKVDLVIFSGDAAYQGRAEEFQRAKEIFFEPVLRACNVSAKHLFMVPGNHDIDRKVVEEFLPPSLRNPLKTDQEVQSWLTESKKRQRALEPFEAYDAFVQAYTGQSSPSFATQRTLEIGGRRIALLGLNSAWMCARHLAANGEVDDYGHLIIGEPQIHDAIRDISNHDLRIVVVHHPIEWLAAFEKPRIRERLLVGADIVFSGHEHDPKVTVVTDISGSHVNIPAGATFDGRRSPDPRYTNSYNFVHFDLGGGEGCAFLRRWLDPRNRWGAADDVVSGGRREFPLRQSPVPKRKPSSAPSARRDELAEERYRSLMLETCDIVDLANLPEQDRHLAQRQLELRRLFVPLRARRDLQRGSGADKDFFDQLEQRRAAGALRETETNERVAIGVRLAEIPRLVVLGDPGSGKTTLTRWLATAYLLRSTGNAEWREMPDFDTLPDRDWMPIIVRCRDLDPTSIRGALEDILQHTLRKSELGPLAAAVQKMLRRRIEDGKAILILDGLDEINDPKLRIQFCQQIEQIAAAQSQLAIIATSRIVGYREIGMRLARGFEHLTLVDLEPGEKDEFARNWCKLTERPERQAAAAAELISDIHSNDRIERLTGNPMLLTTMALVKRKVGRLPQRRADLYWEAVQVLLNWRSEIDEPLDPREAVPQLEYLAYAMSDRGVQQLREDEIVELFTQMRRDFPNLRSVQARKPDEFVKALERRTGILIEAGRSAHEGVDQPVYEFRHLSLQEYLTARAIVYRRCAGDERLKDVASLVSSTISRTIISQQNEETVISESWREPLRLCTTICDDHDVDAVMRAILEPAKGEGHGIARARAIQAMQCLADEPNVSEAIGKGIAEQFARHISEGDGDGHGTSIADKAALEIVSTPWVEPVRGALIAEFMDRAADVRGSAGGVASLLARSKSQDGGLARLCNELMAARASSSDIRVASVCLTIMDFAYHRSQERDPISDEETVLRNLVVQLIENLKDAKAVTHAAAWALFWLTTGHRPTEIASPLDLAPPQREVLFDFLGRGDSDVEALAYVAWIAGRTKSMDAVAPLLSRVRHEYKRLAKAAIAALGEIGGSGAVDALLGLLKDVGKDTRLAAAAALGGTGDGRAVDGLLGLLKDVDKDTRWAAAEALGRIGDSRAVDGLLGSLKDVEEDTRVATIYALGETSDSRAVDGLLGLLKDVDKDTRVATIYALGQIGDSRAVDGLLGSLKDVEEDTRAATIYALGKTSDSRAVASLLGLLRDVEQSVRIAALGALATRMDATDKRLLSRDLDGFPPFRDPQDIIDDGTAVTASKLLEMDTSVIRSRYEQMAEKFGLRLGWRP